MFDSLNVTNEEIDMCSAQNKKYQPFKTSPCSVPFDVTIVPLMEEMQSFVWMIDSNRTKIEREFSVLHEEILISKKANFALFQIRVLSTLSER